MRDQEILGLSESYNQVIANEIELEEKSGSPRPTFMPRSRERDIGPHDDWKDKPAEDWNDKTSEQKKADKLRRRASAVVQTQRRQDRETNVREEVLSYLLDEGFASDEKSAEAIMDAMSEAWIESIVEGETLNTTTYDEKTGKRRDVQYPASRSKLGGVPGVMWKEPGTPKTSFASQTKFKRDATAGSDSYMTFTKNNSTGRYKPDGPGV